MAMSGASGAIWARSRNEKLDIADDLDAGSLRLDDDPMRIGMRQRHAGREDENHSR